MYHSEIVISPFRVLACASELPASYESYRRHAEVLDEFDLSSQEGAPCFFAVGRRAGWPELVVAQRFRPAGSGFYPGLLVVPETATVFIGAGERLLAYGLDPSPRRLWVDHADMGFWSWSRFGEFILMSAELELAAWTRAGVKLWSTFVEPPWQYDVVNDIVHLDVMGTMSSFDIARGPSSGNP